MPISIGIWERRDNGDREVAILALKGKGIHSYRAQDTSDR